MADGDEKEVIADRPLGLRLGYARVSTSDQDLRLQIDALTNDGVAEDRIYREKASSGKRRVAFEALMRDVCEGDVVVVWKLDRLGRSLRQVLDTIDVIHKRGAKLRILTQHQQFDTSTPLGNFVLAVVAAFSELERDLIRERTRAGLAAAKARGRIGGRRFTYSDKQIEAAVELIREGATYGEARLAVLDQKGRPITAARLRARIHELEKRA